MARPPVEFRPVRYLDGMDTLRVYPTGKQVTEWTNGGVELAAIERVTGLAPDVARARRDAHLARHADRGAP